ncbi:MAG TPA: signal peptidase I [Anaerolineaceae bacterium]|nr:signal peptidase I [Anaerolineaceae bacterium]
MSSDPYREQFPGYPRQNSGGPPRFLVELLQTVLLALVLYIGVSLVTDRVRVENISMQPTLYENDLLLVNKIVYELREPTYGEVVIFHHTHNPPEDYIKRVIGLPGDTVLVADGVVRVNGVPLNEPYLKELPTYEGTWVVPDDSLFVLGDNRNMSSDSRVWGFVPMEELVGRADLIYWPPEKARLLLPRDIVRAAEHME